MNDSADVAFHDDGFPVTQPIKGVDIYFLALIAIHRGTVVFPDHFFAKRDLLCFCPRVMKQNISAGQQVDIMVSRVPFLGTRRVVFPKHGAI